MRRLSELYKHSLKLFVSWDVYQFAHMLHQLISLSQFGLKNLISLVKSDCSLVLVLVLWSLGKSCSLDDLLSLYKPNFWFLSIVSAINSCYWIWAPFWLLVVLARAKLSLEGRISSFKHLRCQVLPDDLCISNCSSDIGVVIHYLFGYRRNHLLLIICRVFRLRFAFFT